MKAWSVDELRGGDTAVWKNHWSHEVRGKASPTSVMMAPHLKRER